MTNTTMLDPNLEATPPEPEAAASPQPKKKRAAKPKTKTATTKPAKPASKGRFGYEGSIAQRCDQALLAGGTWKDIAEKAGAKLTQVRACAKIRCSKGKFRLEENGDQVRLVPVEG
jgi:hypothetical protein